MPLSRRIETSLQRASWIRRMFEAAAALRKERGADAVADLSLGNPCNEPPDEFFDFLREEAETRTGLRHRYMTNAGYGDVREAVARHLRTRTALPYEADDVCMTVGAAGALNALLRSLIDPGDQVICVAPAFVEYPFYVENFGGTVVETGCDADFFPDPEKIASACTPATRAVLLNSPNNPTGRIYPAAVYRRVAAVLQERSAALGRPILLLLDDPYHHLYYTEEPPPEAAPFYDQTIYVTSFSKDLGLAGERIGYLAIHPSAADRSALRSALPFAMRALGLVNAPALFQRAAARLLDLSRESVRAFYRERRDRVVAALSETGLSAPPLEGAFYAFPKAPEADDVAFCRRMLEQGCVLVPGAAFGSPGRFRLSYAVDLPVLERGLDLLRRCV